MTTRRLRRLSALFAALLLLLLSACGGGGGDGGGNGGDQTQSGAGTSGDDPGKPVEGGEVVMAVESETNAYSPHTFAGTAAGYNAAWLIFDPLIVRDKDGALVPYLAESLTHNDALTEFTIKLRPNVKFSDGTPLDAQTQKDAFEEFLRNGKGTRRQSETKEVASVEVVDPLTYKYVLSAPNAAWPDYLVGPIGWPFSVTAARAAGEDFASKPVGTGPYVLQEWTRDSQLIATKNPNYWQKGLPHLDKVTIRPIPDEDARGIALQAGDIDATHSVRLSQFLTQMRDMAKSGEIELYEAPGNSGSGTIFNTTNPPLDDVRVRRSLAFAMKPEDLISVVAGAGATKPRTTYYAPESPWFSKKASDAYPVDDPVQAKKLADEYRNDPKRSDGKPVGAPIAFEFACTAIPSLQAQAQAYQSMWNAVGYQVDLKPVEQSVHIQNAIEGKFQANCWRMGSDADPYTHLSVAHGDPAKNPGNFTNFSPPELQALIDQLRTTGEQKARFDILEKIQVILAEQVPVVWTGGNNEFIAAKPDVKGVATWKTPDGKAGNGANGGITFWSQVWRDKS
jgi:peptide/nickel transport system substrate-binding protein